MPYNIWKKTLQLLGMNAIITVICLVIMFSLGGLTEDEWLGYTLNGLCVFILLLFVWGSLSDMGLRDITSDELEKKRLERVGREPMLGVPVHFKPANGFIIGAVAQAPFALIALLTAIPALGDTVLSSLRVTLNVWYVMFSEMSALTGYAWWTYILYAAAFTALAGLAYRSGPTKKRRIRTIIARNEKKIKSRQKSQPQGRGSAGNPQKG
ncbi:MAG: hypothetical protein GX549_02565 [Clostridiales bacterium]|nr:hypothetical protein [Clostridiales bacterium]